MHVSHIAHVALNGQELIKLLLGLTIELGLAAVHLAYEPRYPEALDAACPLHKQRQHDRNFRRVHLVLVIHAF